MWFFLLRFTATYFRQIWVVKYPQPNLFAVEDPPKERAVISMEVQPTTPSHRGLDPQSTPTVHSVATETAKEK